MNQYFKIGKKFELYYGKDIFVEYHIIEINYEEEVCRLQMGDFKYAGGDEFVNVSMKKLYKKRKVLNW